MKQIVNSLGYILTPTALMVNIGEWFGSLTINQSFTIVISSFVVLFWAFKSRKEYVAYQIERRKLELLEENNEH
jgi:hypothetical protein